MKAAVVDIDDTLLDTSLRMQGIWLHVLGVEIPLSEIETLTLEQIFMRHASTEQRTRISELQRLFFSLLLCEDEKGVELAKLDRPIPDAAETLQAWTQHYRVIYLTGRPEHTRNLTQETLAMYGFPVDNVLMSMVTLQDWKNRVQTKARQGLLASLAHDYDVELVVDDFPGYFTIYRDLQIPVRIGLRSKKFSASDYIDKGATRVVDDWKELREDYGS